MKCVICALRCLGSVLWCCNSASNVSVWRFYVVQVCCEDLVGLLIAALAQSGGKQMVASYLEISVLLLQKVRYCLFFASC